jgi:hypothetical protein
VAALDANVPDPAERDRLEREAPAWVARFTVAWVIKAILEAAERRKVEKVHSLAGYARSMLEDWAKVGHPTPRLTKAAARPSETNAPRPEEAAARKAERRESEAAESRRIRLWGGLSAAERAAIEAEVSSATPEMPRPLAGLRLAAIRNGCLERMDALPAGDRGA